MTLHSGKDDEIFGFSATAPNTAGDGWLRHFGPTSVTYLADAGKGLTIQGGIFSSLIGYDSLYARDNLNYTRPWGADFTPYLMLGVNASYPVTGKLTLTGFAVNGYWSVAASLRLEHRVDRSTGPQGGFFTNRLMATGNPALTPTQHLAIVALVLRFDAAR